MIDVYSWRTSNGRKVNIMVEELGVDYELHPINIMKDDQFTPEFIKINPNAKIPAIIDRDGPDGKPYTVFESGAILMYLAEKHGALLPADTAKRYDVIQWLMWQMGGVGPMFGQAHHFRRNKTEVPYAIERYTKETHRLWGVLDKRLEGREWVCDDYSIADIALYPWCDRWEWHGIDLDTIPNAKGWMERMAARPAVQRGMAMFSD